jgi:hypothetical protein
MVEARSRWLSLLHAFLFACWCPTALLEEHTVLQGVLLALDQAEKEEQAAQLAATPR